MPTTPPKSPKKKQSTINYAKYTGMAFQMFAIIGLGVFAGIKLDAYLGFKKIPVFTIILALTSAAAAIYLMIKEFLKK